jgi:hypothetical protein
VDDRSSVNRHKGPHVSQWIERKLRRSKDGHVEALRDITAESFEVLMERSYDVAIVRRDRLEYDDQIYVVVPLFPAEE